MPTEAEWEYACRAGSRTLYYFGDKPEGLAQVGNVADAAAKAKFSDWVAISANDGHVFTAPVGKFQPNAFGLYDMHGNVWEWCADWYDGGYYFKLLVDVPTGLPTAKYRVLRGGAWDLGPIFARSACRFGGPPVFRGGNSGFRVVRTP